MNPYPYIVVMIYIRNTTRDKMKNKSISVPGYLVGAGIIALTLILTYLGCFHSNIFAQYAQLIMYCVGTGYLTTIVAKKILGQLSPATVFMLKGKKTKQILTLILASEFVVLIGLGLGVGFRTVFLWAFIPIYQILSKLRSIPVAEDMDEKMMYIPDKV